jgi:hypothetical protein
MSKLSQELETLIRVYGEKSVYVKKQYGVENKIKGDEKIEMAFNTDTVVQDFLTYLKQGK